jgi:hypothetical protein
MIRRKFRGDYLAGRDIFRFLDLVVAAAIWLWVAWSTKGFDLETTGTLGFIVIANMILSSYVLLRMADTTEFIFQLTKAPSETTDQKNDKENE